MDSKAMISLIYMYVVH